MASPRALADTYHREWLTAHPFTATSLGLSGYDALVPEDSEDADAARRAIAQSTLAETEAIDASELDVEDAITLGCVAECARQELLELDSSAIEHTVTAMPYSGPAELLAVAARTVLVDADAAEHYLERLRRGGAWIDQLTQRLEIGDRKGRRPVASLVQQAITWGEAQLGEDVPAALVAPATPKGWDGASSWSEARDGIARDVLKPALEAWLEQLRVLLPKARSNEHPGLTYLPGGDEDYERAIRRHTTLPLSADELHATGLAEIEILEARLVELGSTIGLRDLDAVHEALRRSAASRSAHDAIGLALTAIQRAEAAADSFFPAPLPAPCAVTPMPAVVGESGAAPHYTPPRLDGGRPGTYWFNVSRPTAGGGWDLESVAFHEAVPGHHLQFSRLQLLGHLPALQREHFDTVYAEGWGLYAEQLAEEMGLYGGTEAILGAIAASLMRAARLVIDTGIHAFGWSREKANAYFDAHVPMLASFLANEVDRYIVMPGQALAYLTGKREILRLREEARQRLGSAFSLPAFHAAVLDSGSLPMPVLAAKIGTFASS